MTKSWRAKFYVEFEVTADDALTAVAEACEALLEGRYDSDQVIMDDIFEVDPETGCEVGVDS
jgi:hypothetical protein